MNRHRVLRVALFLALLVGTAGTTGCGLGSTEADSRRSIARVARHDARMLVDDLGLFSQTNRPFRGSRWIVE